MIRGTNQADQIRALGGNDFVAARDGNDEVNGGTGVADRVDARDSGGDPTRADTVICKGGDEVRVDRNDTIVNRARCGSVERD